MGVVGRYDDLRVVPLVPLHALVSDQVVGADVGVDEAVAGERGSSAITQVTQVVEVANGPGIEIARRVISDPSPATQIIGQHHAEVGQQLPQRYWHRDRSELIQRGHRRGELCSRLPVKEVENIADQYPAFM